jgi:hypothetical protein
MKIVGVNVKTLQEYIDDGTSKADIAVTVDGL